MIKQYMSGHSEGLSTDKTNDVDLNCEISNVKNKRQGKDKKKHRMVQLQYPILINNPLELSVRHSYQI